MSKSYAEPSHLSIGNDKVELKLDSRTGYIRDIFSKETGLHHKSDASGIWPFGLRMGDGYSPDLLRVQIDASDDCADQTMSYEVTSTDGAATLRMTYDNMLTTGGAASGIKLTVHISVNDGADYFLIGADVENHGKYDITNIFSGWGALHAGADRAKEHFAVPDWSMGTIWDNPCSSFAERDTFGYPTYGNQGNMTAGWMDLYCDEGGIGIGYINKQQLMMYFNAQAHPLIPNSLTPPREDGFAFNWQLLNLFHTRTTEKVATIGGAYPIRPGESFSTDPWILAPHTGDWHRMADIYRHEYQRAFSGDFTRWQDVHEEAKRIDLTVFQTVYAKEEGAEGFQSVAPAVQQAIEKSGVAPEHLMVSILAFWQKAPLYFPDHFPRGRENANAAIAAFKQAVADIRAMGVESVMLLTHLFYNHPKAVDYVPEAETDYDHQNVYWNDIGHVACVEQEEWQNLWKHSYIPGFDSVDVSGVLLDQGPIAHLVCTNPDHVHGTDTVKMLGSFSRGTDMQIKAFREGFRNRKAFLWSECSGDLPTRNVDMWAGNVEGHPNEPGALRTMEIVRYTFPEMPCAYTAFKLDWKVRDVNECLVKSYVAGGYFGFEVSERWPPELDEAIAQYVRIRKELRDSAAPGYPQGFRDTVGLRVGDPSLVARVYVGDRGMTVVYYATEQVRTVVEIDREVLGFRHGHESFHVSLQKDEAGYEIIEV